jgi:hypothetical protein
MRQGTLDFTFVGPVAENGPALRKRVFDAWRKLQLLYKQTGGPKIFATYYDGASERVGASEPVTSFKKFTC